MTDRAKQAIAQLMYTEPGAAYQGVIGVVEAELLRCLAETLREAAEPTETRWDGNTGTAVYYIYATLHEMADEADKESADE